MDSSSRARGSGYGSLGGSRLGDGNSSSGGGTGKSTAEGSRHQRRPWLRACIASVAVVAALGLLRASRPVSRAPTGDHLTDPSAGSFVAEGAEEADDAPHASAFTPAVERASERAAAPDAGEERFSFVASNEYTRRGDIVGLGYPWLQVGCCTPSRTEFSRYSSAGYGLRYTI